MTKDELVDQNNQMSQIKGGVVMFFSHVQGRTGSGE